MYLILIVDINSGIVESWLPVAFLSVFIETPSPASVSLTFCPSYSLLRDMGLAYTGEHSVVNHALSFHVGTCVCGLVVGRVFLRRMPPSPPPCPPYPP